MPKIGIVFALDGEDKFVTAMKKAQEGAKQCDQELKNLQEEFAGNANSMEALTRKQEQLKQKQDSYKRALEEAKRAQQNANDNYLKGSANLKKLEEDLEEARREMERMEKAGDTSSKAYKSQAKAVGDLEKQVSRQAAEVAKADVNISKWDTTVRKAESDVRKTSTAVDKNNKYLNEAKTSADHCATSIDKMGNEMKETAQEADKMGSGLKDALSVAVGNLMSQGFDKLVDGAKQAAEYIVDVGSTFEASMSKVEALSGASGAQLEALSDKAKELGASTQYSASQVADAFGYMSLAGWKTEDMLQGIDGVLNLAAASGMDLATASDMVTDFLSAFGLTAADAGHMVDMLAYAQANSNTTTQQLGDAFGNCAANMNAAGQDMETTTAILEAFANQGIKGSEAGTKLSAIMRDITAKMKDGKIQIGDTAVAVTDANGNFRDLTDILMDVESATNGMGDAEKAAALSATFTSRSVGGLNMILNEGVGNIASYEQALRNSDGAAKDMAATMQDNLQGKVAGFKSALEGLGIYIYNQIATPLGNAVDVVTRIISDITKSLQTEKSDLDKFLESVTASNQAVEEAIGHAKDTVANAEAEVNKLEGTKDFLQGVLENCAKYNEVDISAGTSAITEELGKSEKAAKDTADKIKDVGDAEIKTDNVTGAEETINSSLTGIKEEAGNTSEALKSVGDSVEGVQSATDALGYLKDAEAGVVVVTDEFTKFKITNIVNELAATVPELAAAWNAETGELQLTNQALTEYIQKAEDGVRVKAYASAQEELLKAVYQAEINAEMAQSALTAATNEYNKVAGESKEVNVANWVELEKAAQSTKDAEEATEKAAETQQKATENYKEAKEELELLRDTAKRLGIDIDGENESLESNTEATQNAATATEELTEAQEEAINAFGELTGKTTSELAELQTQLGMSNEEFANWCTQRTEETQKVIEAYQSLVESVATSMHDFATSIDTSGEEGSTAIDNMVKNLTDKTAELRTWVDNMKTLGQMAGKELPQGLYDELLQGGPAKTAEAVQALVDAAQKETGKFEEVANQYNEALSIEAEAGNLAQYSSTGKAYAEAVKEGFVGSQAEYEAAVAETMESGASTAQSSTDGYTEAGKQATDNVASGEEAEAAMVENASKSVVEAGVTAANTALEMFKEVGRLAMISVSIGMNEQKDAVGRNVQGVVENAKTQADTTAQTFNETGSTAGSQFATGLNDQRSAAVSAGQSVALGAKGAAAAYEGSFYSIGSFMGQGLSQGIMSQAHNIANAAANVVRQALAAARAAGAISSPSRKFRDMVGKEIGAGVAWGIKQSTNLATDAAEELIGQTVAAMSGKLKGASSQEVTYAWQQTANSFIEKAFGVSKTTTSGSGKNQQTVAKDTETYYNDVYKAAQTYMARVKSLYDVSEKDELAYWKKVQARLKVGTAAWYAATDQVNKLTASIAKEAEDNAKKAKEAAEEAAAAERQMYADIVSAADDYLEHQNITHTTSIKRELAYWKAIRNTLKAGTQAYDDATKKIVALEGKIGTIGNAEGILDTYKTYYEISEAAEVEYWDIVRKQYAAGTQERIDADKHYFEAKKNLNDKLKALEDDYRDKVKEVNDELERGIQELTDKYNSAVQQRAEAIYGAFGWQDEFKSESVTGKQLVFNAESQAAGYAFWRDELNDLESRQILSDRIIAELREKGPQETATVVALNSLSDEDLQKFQTAQDQKWEIALEQSKKENEGLKKETDEAIKQLKKNAEEETKKLTDSYTENRKSLEKSLDGGLKGLATSIKTISEDEVRLLATAIGGVLKDQDAKTSTGAYVSSGAINAASGAGTTGLSHNGKAQHDAGVEILESGSTRRKTLKDNESNYSPLFQHIVTNYGVQPNQAMYHALGAALGVKTSETVTGSEMAQILTAMNKNGLRRGTKYLDDAFAWMDEAGIGSELIVRKKDGAILNTAVQKGDAIIPADLTDNLYRWGSYDPDIVIPQVMSAARMNALAEAGYRSVGGATGSNAGTFDQMLSLMVQFMPYLAEKTQVTLDGRGLVDYTSQEMAKRSRRVRG